MTFNKFFYYKYFIKIEILNVYLYYLSYMEHLKDILNFLLSSNDEPIHIFNNLLTNLNDIKKGFTFEGLCIILEISKCLNIEYDEYMGGSLLHYHKLENVNDLLNKNIQSGNDASDMTIKHNENIITFSIKYKNKITPKDTDILILYETLKNTYINQFKIGLIVKDKKMLLKHKYSNKNKRYKRS